MGSWSLGCYGNKEVISPTLDRMAKEGMRFENFFCTSPVCSPARASILTGKMPSQHGVLDWLGGGSVDKKDYKDIKINLKKAIPYLEQCPEHVGDIADDEQIAFEATRNYQRYMNYEKGGIQYLRDHLCYTEILEKNGYECGLVGKWHLGDSAHMQKGFRYWEVIARGGTNYYLPEYIRDGKVCIEEGYVTDIITDDALEFIRRNAGKEHPFYLSVHYTAPHDPWQKSDQPKEIWDLYENCPFESVPVEARHPDQLPKVTQPSNEEERRYYVRGYYTCITAMDRNIARILNTLESSGVMENTIVVFLSDNGFNMGHHGIWGKGNGTFPLNMYESSVKVPFIICGKNIRKGGVAETLVSQYDIFPTILELCGCSAQEAAGQDALPGVSFAQLLDGKTQAIRNDVVIFDEYGAVRMIREERYKLVYRTPYGPHELYDLAQDPDERINLVADPQYRQKKYELYLKLHHWFEKYTNSLYDGTRYPVDGYGQMNTVDNFGRDVVFKSF